jgi:trimeric autotransporter adhesin
MKQKPRKLFATSLILFFCVSANAQIITTFAGNGIPAYAGDGMAAATASLNTPTDVACDTAGNIYIADEFNHVIRKVNPAGIIFTIAGSGVAGYSGDGGPATLAKFNRPTNVFVKGGNIYITDELNHAIRKIDTGGIIRTVAGTGSPGYSGDGGPATAAMLFQPYGIFVDNSGNIYIAEQVNQVIRKVNTSGIITNVAGTGFSGYSGDGGPATAAKFHDPSDITFDASGNLFIADRHNLLSGKLMLQVS